MQHNSVYFIFLSEGQKKLIARERKQCTALTGLSFHCGAIFLACHWLDFNCSRISCFAKHFLSLCTPLHIFHSKVLVREASNAFRQYIKKPIQPPPPQTSQILFVKICLKQEVGESTQMQSKSLFLATVQKSYQSFHNVIYPWEPICYHFVGHVSG